MKYCSVLGFTPVKWTGRLKEEKIENLYYAINLVLDYQVELLRGKSQKLMEKGEMKFLPDSRKGHYVYNRFREPCRECETPIQRIRYADRSTHYCPVCQTDGKILSDRALSRLLKKDRPQTIEKMEAIPSLVKSQGGLNG